MILFSKSGATCKQLLDALNGSDEFQFRKVTSIDLAMIHDKDYYVEDIDFIDDSNNYNNFEIHLKSEENWSAKKHTYRTETFKKSINAHNLNKARVLLNADDKEYRMLFIERNKYHPAVIWFCDSNMIEKFKKECNFSNSNKQQEYGKQLDF